MNTFMVAGMVLLAPQAFAGTANPNPVDSAPLDMAALTWTTIASEAQRLVLRDGSIQRSADILQYSEGEHRVSSPLTIHTQTGAPAWIVLEDTQFSSLPHGGIERRAWVLGREGAAGLRVLAALDLGGKGWQIPGADGVATWDTLIAPTVRPEGVSAGDQVWLWLGDDLEPATGRPPTICDNLLALQAQAQRGALELNQIQCLHASHSMAKEKEERENIACVLIANTWVHPGSADSDEARTLFLDALDHADQAYEPARCVELAAGMDSEGKQQVLHWVDAALQQKATWSPDLFRARVAGLYLVRDAVSPRQGTWQTPERDADGTAYVWRNRRLVPLSSVPAPVAVPMTEPWLSMKLPIGAGVVVTSRPYILNVVYQGRPDLAVVAAYQRALQAAGWTGEPAIETAEGGSVTIYTKPGKLLKLGAVPNPEEGKTTLVINGG